MKYTCQEYRQEMVLLALKKRLAEEKEMDAAEKQRIRAEINLLEQQMGMA